MPPKPNKQGNNPQPNQGPVANATTPPHASSVTSADTSHTPPTTVEITALKTELLPAPRSDVATIFKTELHEALGANLVSIKAELLTLKTELSGNISAIQADVTGLTATVNEMEHSLSTCSDDIATLQSKVEHLTKEWVKLENKCDDLESRARRQNIRIVGVSEDDSDSGSVTGVSRLLMEAFKLDKEPLVDRAHRSLMAKPKPGDRPRAIVAKLHYFRDCSDILRKARELQRIKIRNMTISVFPDHTAKTVRARAAFNDVRRQLREIEGIRFGLLHPARLRITHGGVQKDFTSPEEAESFIKSLKN